MLFNRKHFLDLKSLSCDEIYYILNSAQKMKCTLASKKYNTTPFLKGKTVATLFYEEHSRSKLSFELAAQNLSAKVIHLTTSKEFTRGESLKDLGRSVDQMGADFIVIRHPMSGGPHYLTKYVQASIINAGDGRNENPSQSLVDLLSVYEQKNHFEGLKVAIIGDIMHNRVARSNIWGLTKLGAKVAIAGPPTLLPSKIGNFVEVHNTITEAIIDADVIMTLKIQSERQEANLLPSINEYMRLFKLDNNRLKYAKDDVIVMHPGPINRGIEISSEVIDGDKSVINMQQMNGVAVRMALFHLLSKGGLNYDV
ncbi:aspartate carbamoyltransferase catalytic subunit [Vallitalea pronyensis]|uniref:Aspartate carbamoyltransferase n=1 Tax=Vallitalea pronyensis TaxID=1348613 RepID=A0A8J8MKL8_9FIRM|nr:aspartate carbamoyltransferase catalytic subunit [Vallitalea pronyensis]QUI23400.1 aspartate carbamoyltransferase catalytic subunit [Vallitalea pronyensis]